MITNREKRLLYEVLQGKTSKDISIQWGNSVRTIEKLRETLIHKNGCKNLYEVIGICLKNKWIE